MKITSLNSASVLIEENVKSGNVKILCDPWLVNGEFFNAWGIYPPYDFEPKNFSNINL